jgi:hypothetical protein
MSLVFLFTGSHPVANSHPAVARDGGDVTAGRRASRRGLMGVLAGASLSF